MFCPKISELPRNNVTSLNRTEKVLLIIRLGSKAKLGCTGSSSGRFLSFFLSTCASLLVCVKVDVFSVLSSSVDRRKMR